MQDLQSVEGELIALNEEGRNLAALASGPGGGQTAASGDPAAAARAELLAGQRAQAQERAARLDAELRRTDRLIELLSEALERP